MSKIGTIHMELEEQAAELGFESLEQATNAGCEINWLGNTAELVEPLEAAHRAWEEERKKVLGYARDIMDSMEGIYQDDNLYKKAVEIVKFIEEVHE